MALKRRSGFVVLTRFFLSVQAADAAHLEAVAEPSDVVVEVAEAPRPTVPTVTARPA